MGISIVFSLVAKDDLKNIFEYIKRDSLIYARKEINAIRSRISKVRLNLYVGKKFENFNNDNIRELIFKNYRIIYEIESDRIIILTIHHHSRLLYNNPALNDED
jgi:plasmid stabilization system protein ParE